MDSSQLNWLHHNKLLSMLPESDLVHLMPRLKLQEVQYREMACLHGAQIDHVDFPCTCVYSRMFDLADGRSSELGLIGNEGVTNAQAMLHTAVGAGTLICQFPGMALRMPLQDFVWEADHNPRLRYVLDLYWQADRAQLAQRVACNQFHTLDQRAARWLLSAHDRIGADEFPLTQETFAALLGAQRPTISIVAQKLHNEGAIAYSRGRLRILDRRILEARCCECYGSTRAGFERLLGARAG